VCQPRAATKLHKGTIVPGCEALASAGGVICLGTRTSVRVLVPTSVRVPRQMNPPQDAKASEPVTAVPLRSFTTTTPWGKNIVPVVLS